MSERKALIHVRDLRRTYVMGTTEVHALRGVDLDIYEGEFTAIIGPSGSGKSTLMYLLGLLDTPTSGSYCLNGEEVADLDDDRLSEVRNREIGFQQYHLLAELDVVDNVALGLTYGGAPVGPRRELAARLVSGLGLAERLTHTALELSGGQQQRVAIARAWPAAALDFSG